MCYVAKYMYTNILLRSMYVYADAVTNLSTLASANHKLAILSLLGVRNSIHVRTCIYIVNSNEALL